MIRLPAIRLRGSAAGRLLTAMLAVALLSGIGAPPVGAADSPEVIAPGVTVDGTAVGGLTRDEATAVLQTALAHYAAGEAIIGVDDRTAHVGYAALGRRADIATLVDVAWSIGRSDPASLPGGLGSLIHGTAIDPFVIADTTLVQTAIASAAAATAVAPVNGTAKVTDTGFARTAAHDGQGMPQQEVIDQLTPRLTDPTTASPIAIAVSSVAVAPAVSDADVTAAIAAARRMVRTVVLVHGTEKWSLATTAVRSWIRFRVQAGAGYRPVVAETAATASLKSIARSAAIAARNARILSPSRGIRLTNVTIGPARNGRRLDLTATTSRVAAAVNARAVAPASAAAIKVQAAFAAIKPTVDDAQARALAKRLRRQGPGWTTRYVVGEANGFGANITIPARTLNGFILGPGEEFSFWSALGEVSYRKGYRNGGAIIGGHTNPTGALAGGICSASTTLFNAAARAGLDVVERHNHYYYIARYPRGLDATVSGGNGGGGQNMRFRNDTKYPVLVRGFAGPGWVTFQVWGVPNGRKVTFSAPVISNYQRAYDTVQYTNSLRHGVRKRIEYAVDGFNSVVVRTVRDAAGTMIHHDTFVSGYHRVLGIVLVGR
jgi:vancomycin resistance protein YoaR